MGMLTPENHIPAPNEYVTCHGQGNSFSFFFLFLLWGC